MLEEQLSTDEMIDAVIKKAKELNLAQKQDKVIIIAGIPWGRPGTTNTVKIHDVK